MFIPYFHLLVFGILVTLVAWFSFHFFSVLPILQNVNKDYVIFLYFLNFVAKSDQKPNTKNGMNKTNVTTKNFVKHLHHINSDSTRVTIEVTLQCRTSSDWRKLPWKFISWPFCEVVVVVIDVSTVQDILKKVSNF